MERIPAGRVDTATQLRDIDRATARIDAQFDDFEQHLTDTFRCVGETIRTELRKQTRFLIATMTMWMIATVEVALLAD